MPSCSPCRCRSNRPPATKHPCMDYFPTPLHRTERDGIAITLYITFRRSLFRISTGTSALMTDTFRGLSESFQANTEMIPQLGNNFLPNQFQFISHSAIQRCYILDADSVMEQPTRKVQNEERQYCQTGAVIFSTYLK